MGIKNLNTLLLKYCNNNGIVKKKLNLVQDKYVAIDTSIFLYKYQYNGSNIYDKFLKQIYILLKNKIKPIYIFDGKACFEKQPLLEKRRKNRNKKEIELYFKKEELNNPTLSLDKINEINNDINKITKNLIYVKKNTITNLKNLMNMLYINYIQASGEADAVCAQLFKNKLVIGCITEDMDLLAYGCNIIKNFNLTNEYITYYNFDNILKNLNLTKKQFIDICILSGCDYTNKIPGIGIMNAYKLINKYKDIENTIINYCSNKNITVPDNFNYNNARNIFNSRIDNIIYNEGNNFSRNSIMDIIEFISNISTFNKFVILADKLIFMGIYPLY